MNQVVSAQSGRPDALGPLTILHVLAPGIFGGLEHVVTALARGQIRCGNRVHVAAILDATGETDGQLLTGLKAEGVTVHVLKLRGRAYLKEYQLLSGLFETVAPDVVHTHGYRADVIGGRAARRKGLATVATVHGSTRGDLKNRFYEWVQRRSYRRFDAVVAVARAQLPELVNRGADPARVFCVPNAWSGMPSLTREAARRALDIPDEAFVIGWVGRLSHEKGADVLLAAGAEMAPEPDVIVSMIGDGPLRASLQSQAETSANSARVLWHGAVAESGRLFKAFDVFVLSSRTEGTPIVLFEAMAAEVPIVAAAVGGVPDVVSPAEAILVPPENPRLLARAITEVRHGPESARRRAVSARRRLEEHYDSASWIARYDAVYRGIQRAGHSNRLTTIFRPGPETIPGDAR